MKDTPPDIERKFRAMLLKRSGAERLKMGCSMHSTARALAKAALLQEHPDARPAELKRLLFLRFYGTDFAPKQRNRIALALSKSSGTSEARQARVRVLVEPPQSQTRAQVAEPAARYGSKHPVKKKK